MVIGGGGGGIDEEEYNPEDPGLVCSVAVLSGWESTAVVAAAMEDAPSAMAAMHPAASQRSS